MVSIASETAGDDVPRMSRTLLLRAGLAVAALAILIALAVALGLPQRLSLDSIRSQRASLLAFVAAHPVASVLIYCGVYVTVVSLSLPGALVMSLAGGFLFGPPEGTFAAAGSVTLGSLIMFGVARTALGAGLALRISGHGGVLGRIEATAIDHPFSTILTCRLIPAVPIFMVNLAAGLIRLPFAPFALATLIGVSPSTYLYVSVGSGLDHLFETVEPEALMGVIRSELALPALGLCCLAVLPLGLHWLRGRRLGQGRKRS